jgi:putative hemolysin
VREIMRPIPYVPGTIALSRLLVTMQRKGHNVVGIVNEYGGTTGILTLEDVLEEVVGDIEDEYDVGTPFVKKMVDNRLVVGGRVPVEQLNEFLPQKIPPGEYETLAGFLLARMQKVPKSGDRYYFRKMIFQVTRATKTGVEEVEILV